MASASTSTSSSVFPRNYHVFINHRGSDVKKTFANNLYHRLLSHGLQVFLDQPELEPGENIPEQIEQAIDIASVHVAIFSPRYAQSKWCLDELVLMLKSRATRGATILPVFYGVEPFVLRLRGKDDEVYAEAMRIHEKKNRYDQPIITDWKGALYEVSLISGFELKAYNGDEGELVDEVARQVLKKARKEPLPVATHPTATIHMAETNPNPTATIHEEEEGKGEHVETNPNPSATIHEEEEGKGEHVVFFNATRHDHELRQFEGLPAYKCRGCKEIGANIGYKCNLNGSSSCNNFTLHEACARLPDVFQNPFRTNYKFRPKTHLRHDCTACRHVLKGYVFESESPGVRLHPLCMTLPEKLDLARHADHTLKLVRGDLKGKEYTCSVCDKKIDAGGWRYRCEELACKVYVDLSCAKIEMYGLSDYGNRPSNKSNSKSKLNTVLSITVAHL